MIIREATISDAISIAKVHIDSWRTTYKGIVSDEHLRKLSYSQKEKAWINIINDAQRDIKYIFVAEDEKNNIIGFTSCGIEREGHTAFEGEIYALYIIKEYQNKGVGKLLFNRAVEKLNEMKFHSMLIWALEENNQASWFYELMGGKKVKEKYVDIGNDKFKEVAYGWINIFL